MKSIVSVVVLFILFSCSKGGSDEPDVPKENKKDFSISALSSPDSVAIKQTFDAATDVSTTGMYSYSYKLTLNGQVVSTKDGSDNKATFETSELKEGSYQLEVSVKNSDGVIKTLSKKITVLNPVFGVAIFGSTKEKVIETEKRINNKDPYTVLTGLESKLNTELGVEKVMFKYSQAGGVNVYYFKGGKFIGAESYPTFLSNGNYYATYFGIKQIFDNFFNSPGIVTDEKFSFFTKAQLDDLLTKHDYMTISAYVSTGQYSVAHAWSNQVIYANSYIKRGYQNAVTAHFEIALK